MYLPQQTDDTVSVYSDTDMNDTPPKDDFFQVKEDLVPCDLSVGNGTYGTVTPIFQNFIKKLFISGKCEDVTGLSREISRISSAVKREDIERFFEAKRASEGWLKAREEYLDRLFQLQLQDEAKLANFIDVKYDIEFDRLRGAVSEKLKNMQEDISTVRTRDLKAIGETLKLGMEMQRLARNLSQSKRDNPLSNTEESDVLKERLEEVEKQLKAKTVDAVVLKPE